MSLHSSEIKPFNVIAEGLPSRFCTKIPPFIPQCRLAGEKNCVLTATAGSHAAHLTVLLWPNSSCTFSPASTNKNWFLFTILSKHSFSQSPIKVHMYSVATNKQQNISCYMYRTTTLRRAGVRFSLAPPLWYAPGGLITTVLSLGLTPRGIPQRLCIMISPPVIVMNPPSVICI